MGDARPSDSNSNSILTFDDLLRQRAVDEDQSPLLAYPKTKTGVSDYELINGATLNRFVDGAAKCLLKLGFEPVYEETVVGIYAPSDLDYIITIFGLGRLGYTPFLLSPRLPATTVSSLLTTCNSNILFHNDNLTFANSVQKLLPSLKILSLLTRSDYDSPTHSSTPEFSRQNLIPEKEFMKKYLMLHSSGSTGLPKPIHYTNKRIIVTFLSAHFKRTFQSVPFSHAHGLVTYVQAIYTRHTLYIMNGHVPQTHKTVTEAIRVANPQVVWTVPYVLKLLAEGEEGIRVLQGAEVVSSSGSRCPDDLGDLLVGRGVNLGLTFGSTETAQILSSVHRPPGDTAWNYLRPLPHVAPYLIMRPVPDSDSETEIYECIILDGHKAKAASNSNDPPNSYHTSDIFEKHPSIENAWKFIGRLDDRITLLNGEKVLPLPVEGRIRQHALVRECVLFGVDRPVPGLLLFRSKNAAGLNDQEFVKHVWPIIQVANSNAEGFSQISREMIVVLGEDIECPLTDKSSVKRAQVYREFSSIIDDTYTRLELSQTGSMQLSQPDLEAWIIEIFEKELGICIPDAEADFFTAGVDSLKAIQMRGLIIKSLDLGGKKCASMIVYDCGNARKLSEKLYGMRIGEAEVDEDGEIGAMKKLIEKYSTFETSTDVHRERLSEGITVLLTGATGSLGSHVLTELEANPNVKEIYCLLRTTKDESAASRLVSSLKSRCLSIPFTKVAAISADLTKPNFGLQQTTLDHIRSAATHIIHCAWSVNFALSVQSFEQQLQSLHNLISFSLTTFGSPARLIFCSSVGTAMATPAPGLVSSSPIADLHHASATGYARSKLISEHIIEAAVTTAGANAIVLRIGQIVPGKKIGSQLWNPNEAVPLMIRSALAVGALPETVNGHGADLCTWLEADELAKVILEIGGIEDPERNPSRNDSQLVYNVVHPRSFSWKSELLPALKAAGLEFEIVSWKTWLDKMARSKDKGNPSKKLLGFWETQGNDESEGGENHEIHFETKGAEQRSPALRRAERVVDGDMVSKLLEAWRKVW